MVNWTAFIPLCGGFPLGAYEATGNLPRKIFTYDEFKHNDSHLKNYWKDVDFVTLNDKETYDDQYDLVVCTPLCSGLSMLNTGKNEEVKGETAKQNEWIYKSIQFPLDNFDPKVIIVENAPRLYTTGGDSIVSQVREMIESRGYSMSLYFTSTHYHGIPQRRYRTFMVIWKSETAPYMNFYRRKSLDFAEYISTVSGIQLQNDIQIGNKVEHEPFYHFLKHRYGDVQSVVKGYRTCLKYIIKNDLMNDFYSWAVETNNEKAKELGAYALEKYANGGEIWDSSINIYESVMDGVISRNMVDTLHPIEERNITIREALHMMGFPHDFELLKGKTNYEHIGQTVPVCTSRDMVIESIKFMNNELPMSTSNFIKQNNKSQEVEYESNSHVNTLF